MKVLDLVGRIQDALFPPLCLHCGATEDRSRPGICDPCLDTIQTLTGPSCQRCGLPRPDSPPQCPRCNHWPEKLLAVAAVRYFGAARTVVRGLKYVGWAHLADVCAGPMMTAMGTRLDSADLIVPVPLHDSRRRERGFNQAERLAEALGRQIGRPVVNAMVRDRPTATQVGLGRGQRDQNVRGAFRSVHRFRPGEVVLLVDDVATSGATLSAASGPLLGAGARCVIGLTYALAVDPFDG